MEETNKIAATETEVITETLPVELQTEKLNEGELNEKKEEVVEKKSKAYPVTEDNTVFKLESYWDERFAVEEVYDWLVTFSDVKNNLLPLLRPEHKILIVGCGNSTFSADLYDAGFENITNIDFSEVCINTMSQKHQNERPKMLWKKMDMTVLKFAKESFDIVIDKAAMDALAVDESDVWDPNEVTIDNIDKMLTNVSRVLKPGGLFYQITFAQPHFRTKYLMAQRVLKYTCSPFESLKGFCSKYNWNLRFETLERPSGFINYFIYVMTKESTSDESEKESK